ncbi:MAG: hypothetical protein U0T83_05600 [Bacteriovoracaceae bacterium]
MSKSDLSREHLYESVKALVESDSPHIHLAQQKLFTLASIAIQYMLFRSTKNPGYYLFRFEDSYLAEKVARSAKDENSRKFLNHLLIPRKFKYGTSTFFLDYFNANTWNLINEVPADKIKGAIIIKNTTPKFMIEDVEAELPTGDDVSEADRQRILFSKRVLKERLYYFKLQKTIPKTVIIAFGETYPDTSCIHFPFIKKEKETLSGVKIAKNLVIDDE